MPRNALIQVRRDTAANWTSLNPTLAAGEMGLETDTGKFKIGTGATAWTSLLYATDASDITGTTLPSNITSSSLTSLGVLTSLNMATGTANLASIDAVGTITARYATDGVRLQGRAGSGGGTNVVLTPETLTATRTLTLPDANGTVALRESLPFKTAADVNSTATYWRSPILGPGSATATTTSSTLGFGAGVPFIFDTPVTISEIGFRTGGTAPSSQIKFLIYSCGTGTGMPQTLQYTSSAVTITAASTTYSVTGLSVALTPGVYWVFIFNVQASTMNYLGFTVGTPGGALSCTPFQSMTASLTSAANNSPPVLLAGSATPTTTLTYGSTLTYSGSSGFPLIAIRRSA